MYKVEPRRIAALFFFHFFPFFSKNLPQSFDFGAKSFIVAVQRSVHPPV